MRIRKSWELRGKKEMANPERLPVKPMLFLFYLRNILNYRGYAKGWLVLFRLKNAEISYPKLKVKFRTVNSEISNNLLPQLLTTYWPNSRHPASPINIFSIPLKQPCSISAVISSKDEKPLP